MSTNTGLATDQRGALRVLLIDPAADDARDVRLLLEGQDDFRVQAARDAREANALLSEGMFDAALVDYALWSEESAGLVRFVREHRPDLAIILLTPGENERETLPILKLGAHDFVSRRNLEADHLTARILAAIEESRTLRRRDTMVRWLEREARTDHLTGLYNRRAFDEKLRETCQKGRARRQPVTLVMVDVVGTRTVNEIHGHEAGDSMIRRAGVGILRSTRAIDFAGRIGGDDFGIIVPDGGLDLGRRIARRIAHEIERLNVEQWGDEIPVTVTFGVASGIGCDPDELLAAADAQITAHRPSRPVISPFPRREETDGPSVA